jgi:acyl carrier protein
MDIDVVQVMAISFFTGFGSAFGIELSKYLIEKVKTNGKAVKSIIDH